MTDSGIINVGTVFEVVCQLLDTARATMGLAGPKVRGSGACNAFFRAAQLPNYIQGLRHIPHNG